jgi:hypothetical protein
LLFFLTLAGLAPLGIKIFIHYFQLVAPFGLLLALPMLARLHGWLSKHLSEKWAVRAPKAALYLLLAPTFIFSSFIVWKDLTARPRQADFDTAEAIRRTLPPRAEVQCVRGFQFMFLSDLSAPRQTGMKAMQGAAPEVDLSAVNYILVYIKEVDEPSVDSWLRNVGFTEQIIAQPGKAVIYYRPGSPVYLPGSSPASR